MPTPKKGYFAKDGKKIPGTTTIIGRFKDSGALIYWAYNQGKNGFDLYESRDKAAELGTIVHGMVEQFTNGEIPDYGADLTTEDREQVNSAFEAFLEWFQGNHFEIVAQEVHLVSEEYRYGGTPDAIARDGKGRLCLLDWKTSNGVYPDYIIQLGAYRMLWNENNPDNPLTGGSHLCRFAKEHGDFAHHYFPDVSEAERSFILMRELYDLDKVLKKRC